MSQANKYMDQRRAGEHCTRLWLDGAGRGREEVGIEEEGRLTIHDKMPLKLVPTTHTKQCVASSDVDAQSILF